MRGVRGATTVVNNTKKEILQATTELLQAVVARNNIQVEDIVSILFTVTSDLNAEFPARAAREMGWTFVPVICAREIEVPGSLPRCIRILMHINTDRSQNEIVHVYLNEAVRLRTDL